MLSRSVLCASRLYKPRIQNIMRIYIKRFKNTEVERTEVETGPIKFSTSKAAEWKASYSSSGKDYYTTPRIQPTIVVLSLTAFMVYFCILREENDLDDWMRELETRVPIQLEEAQLRVEIEQGKKAKKDVSYKEARLLEIEKKKEKAGVNQ